MSGPRRRHASIAPAVAVQRTVRPSTHSATESVCPLLLSLGRAIPVVTIWRETSPLQLLFSRCRATLD